MAEIVENFIGGTFSTSKASSFTDVKNPATGEVVARCPNCGADELNAAVEAAEGAFPQWSETPASRRARLMFAFQALVKEHMDKIAKVITREHGKTFDDAKGDVFRGLEVIEQACAIPGNMKGGFSNNIASNMDALSLVQPLGVCAGICPFNFPSMIPMWMFPLAIACGNTFVLKPSERVPGATMYLAKLFKEAGFPDGVLNVVHGGIDSAGFLCDEPRIKAVSFVGSTPAGEAIYKRVKACASSKRVQCNMGAKNHAVVLPDADKEQAMNALMAAAFGAAGQRCMAISVAVFVGDSSQWIDELAARGAKLKVTEGMQEGADLGPVITPEAKAKIMGIIDRAAEGGCRLPLDGRGLQVEGYPNGNWVGPTLLAGVTPEMECYKTEIFGPVLCCICVDTLQEAIDLCNKNEYGNGTAVFTTSGAHARKFQHQIEAGLVGINVPIPVPPPFFTWSSAKASFSGDSHFFGSSAVNFFTKTKTVLQAWRDAPKASLNFQAKI